MHIYAYAYAPWTSLYHTGKSGLHTFHYFFVTREREEFRAPAVCLGDHGPLEIELSYRRPLTAHLSVTTSLSLFSAHTHCRLTNKHKSAFPSPSLIPPSSAPLHP